MPERTNQQRDMIQELKTEKPDRQAVIIAEYKKRGKLTKKLRKELADMLTVAPLQEIVEAIPIAYLEDLFDEFNPQFKEYTESKKTHIIEVDPKEES